MKVTMRISRRATQRPIQRRKLMKSILNSLHAHKALELGSAPTHTYVCSIEDAEIVLYSLKIYQGDGATFSHKAYGGSIIDNLTN